jgi:hypothetical protein
VLSAGAAAGSPVLAKPGTVFDDVMAYLHPTQQVLLGRPHRVCRGLATIVGIQAVDTSGTAAQRRSG